MPIQTLKLRPGIDTEMTQTLNEGGWSQSQLVRWRDGMPEKIGGWQPLNTTPLIGTPRGMHAWADISGNPYVAVGSEQRLLVMVAGDLIDITPIAHRSNISNCFSTVAGSPTVTITDASYSPNIGDWIGIETAVYVGGLVLQGLYQVTGIPGANQYSISAGANATADETNGGSPYTFTTNLGATEVQVSQGAFAFVDGQLISVYSLTAVGGINISGQYAVTVSGGVATISGGSAATSSDSASENGGLTHVRYLIANGTSSAAIASGYGSGLYGEGLYGQGAGTATQPPRQWFLDNWGSFLIGNYDGGNLCVWNPAPPQPSVDPDYVFGPVGGSAPTVVNSSFVAMPEQIAVTLGADPGNGVIDPNLIRWSDAADYTDFTAATNNQAGSFRIPSGSRIVGGLQAPLYAVIWTDVDMWLMSYIQLPFVFGFNKIAIGCELMAARAAGVFKNNVYWVSNNNFFAFDGNSVEIMPCTVWDKFFDNLNRMQIDKVWCWVNSEFSEVWWFYPSATGTGEVDSYVKVTLRDQGHPLWDYGPLTRTCGVDYNVFGPPLACDASGNIQQHDIEGVYDAAGAPLESYIVSGFMSISDGTFQTFIERLIPDLILTTTGTTARVYITVMFQNYPSDPIYELTFPVTPQTPYLITRFRARSAAVKLLSNDLGVFWRWGAMRYLGQPAGKR